MNQVVDAGPEAAVPPGGETPPGPRPRWRIPRALSIDAAIALVVAVVQVGITALAARRQPERDALDAAGVALLLAASLALVARRRWPEATAAVTLVATAAYTFRDQPRGPVFLAMIVALVTLLMEGRRAAAVVMVGVGYAAFTWGPWLAGVEGRPSVASIVGLAGWLLVLLALGEILRARRDRQAAAARSREEEARRRVSEERMRIARELHDVVAHSISLVNLQAGVALHLIDEQPEQARSALAAIKEASKEALVELRSILGVLRDLDEGAPRDPVPGLDRLEGLVAQARAAGLDVRTVVEGTPGPLGSTVELAAFRIVQEALTNVSRHAGAVPVEVRLAYGPGDLVVEVSDEGRGGRGPAETAGLGAGAGLEGMRERAEAVGGELEAGPRPGFGWRVRARLPHGGAAGSAP